MQRKLCEHTQLFASVSRGGVLLGNRQDKRYTKGDYTQMFRFGFLREKMLSKDRELRDDWILYLLDFNNVRVWIGDISK